MVKVKIILYEALRSLIRKPATIRYLTKPGEMVPIPEGYRGKIVYNREDCVGCLLCTRICPSGAATPTAERKVEFHLSRCLFCAQCRDVCPKKVIDFSNVFDMVCTDKDDLFVR